MQFGEKFGEPSFFDGRERDNIHTWLLRLAHNYGAMNYRCLTEMGIHPGQLPVLRAVSINEGITQRELAQELHVKPPTIAVTIKRMEKAGMIRRREDQTDRRVCRLYLTEAGQQLDKRLKKLLEENGRLMLKGFSEKEVQEMKGYFDRIIQNIQEISENGEHTERVNQACPFCSDEKVWQK